MHELLDCETKYFRNNVFRQMHVTTYNSLSLFNNQGFIIIRTYYSNKKIIIITFKYI